MSGKQFRGLGRYFQNDQEQAQPFFGYAGLTGNDSALAAGLGLYNGENLDVMSATLQAGGYETDKNGFMFGAQAEATSLSYTGTPLDEVASLVGLNSAEEQEYYENLMDFTLSGPSASAEAGFSFEDGISAGWGADWLSAEASLGGSEDEYLWGTELTVGGSIAATSGASFGLHWADEDQDGYNEIGFSLGGDLAAGIGLGADVSLTTEAFGHAYDWLFGSDESSS